MEAAGRTVVVEQVGEAGGGLVLEDFVLRPSCHSQRTEMVKSI